MEIKVLGGGCANCRRLFENTKTAVKELNVEADIKYVTDMASIASSGLLRTPGLYINQKVVSYGRIPSVEEIKGMIQNNLK